MAFSPKVRANKIYAEGEPLFVVPHSLVRALGFSRAAILSQLYYFVSKSGIKPDENGFIWFEINVMDLVKVFYNEWKETVMREKVNSLIETGVLLRKTRAGKTNLYAINPEKVDELKYDTADLTVSESDTVVYRNPIQSVSLSDTLPPENRRQIPAPPYIKDKDIKDISGELKPKQSGARPEPKYESDEDYRPTRKRVTDQPKTEFERLILSTCGEDSFVANQGPEIRKIEKSINQCNVLLSSGADWKAMYHPEYINGLTNWAKKKNKVVPTTGRRSKVITIDDFISAVKNNYEEWILKNERRINEQTAKPENNPNGDVSEDVGSVEGSVVPVLEARSSRKRKTDVPDITEFV